MRHLWLFGLVLQTQIVVGHREVLFWITNRRLAEMTRQLGYQA